MLLRDKYLIKIKEVLEASHFREWIFRHEFNSFENDIYIFSSPRSGSTLLSEIFSRDKTIRKLNEPFLPSHFYLKKYLGRQNLKLRYTYENINHIESKFHLYLFDLLRGIIDIRSYKDILKTDFNINTNRNVLKILRASALIEWFYKYYSQNYIFLFRHPIPVSLSRLRVAWGLHIDDFLQSFIYRQNYLNKNQLIFLKDYFHCYSPLCKYIILWCLENLPLIHFLKLNRGNAKVIFFESLVSDKEYFIEKLSVKYDLKLNYQSYKPSSSTKYSNKKHISNIRNGNFNTIISSWLYHVHQEERLIIQDIFDIFGISFYSATESIPLLNVDLEFREKIL